MSAVTCARCGVAWSLDNRSVPCAMALDGHHQFAEGVTAPEVERLRRIERAARVVSASMTPRALAALSDDFDTSDRAMAQSFLELHDALEPVSK